MSPTDSKVRAQKAARIKIAVLNNTLDLIGHDSFDQVQVSQICERTDISKVTFFKYFPQKEDILLYFQRIWCFRRNVELQLDPMKGVKGIQYLFEKTGETYMQYPGMFLGLISYLTKLDIPVKPFPIKGEEKKLLYPEIDNICSVQIISLEQMFEQFLLEALLEKEITKTSNVAYLKQALIANYYGTIFSCHLKQSDFAVMDFRNSLKYFISSYTNRDSDPVLVYN